MLTARTIAEVRTALRDARRHERTIGLVPTMGALHEGHLSLIRRARSQSAVVVVSIFVNPAQFDDSGDLAAYPRSERRDAALAAAAGADLLFVPSAEEIYPPGFATTVSVRGVSEPLEGAERGLGHFDGVTTVVTKLLSIVGPQVAYFGAKDAQQALVVRRLVADLNLPVRVEVCPIVREADGLALSSRNARLDDDERARAVAISRGLDAARAAFADGEHDAETLVGTALAVMRAGGVEPEYLALVDPDDLRPIERVQDGALLAVAARVGETRLIDNTLLLGTAVAQPERRP